MYIFVYRYYYANQNFFSAFSYDFYRHSNLPLVGR